MLFPRLFSTAAVIATAACVAFSQNYWQQTNGPEGGEVKSLVLAADGSLLATTGPLLFRSTDEGASWGMNPSLFSTSMAVAPNGRVMAGMNGVYASTDNGVTWNTSGLAGKIVYALGSAPNGFLFAACGYPSIIYRSTDNGGSWNIDTTGLGPTPDQAVSFAPGPSGTISVCFLFKGVYRSTNNGDTWSVLYGGGANGVAFGSNGYIYVANSNGVYRSTNGGTSWTIKNSGLTSTSISSILSLPSGDLLVSSNTVYRSTNSGDTWQSIGGSAIAGAAHHLLNNGNTTIYVGVGTRGVYRTTDGGSSWSQQVGGFRATSNQAIATKSSGEILVAGPTDVFVSSDNGATWAPRSSGLGTHAQSIVTLGVTPAGSFLATSSQNATMFRSTNNGVNWSQVSPPAQIPGPFITFSPSVILGGGSGLYRSTNDGVNWARTSTTFLQTVNALIRHSNGTVYVGASYGGVHASADTGKTWTPKGLSGQDIRSLVETASGAMLAAVNYTGIYRTTDGGTSWTPLSTTTTGIQPKKLYRAGSSAILGIFGSTTGDAVFASTDEGSSWTSASSGLPFPVSATDFATTTGGRLLAATAGPAGYSGFGVVSATGSVSDAKPTSMVLPAEIALGQNYPNPFNPATTIQFSLPTAGPASLKVYDLLGREVATLLNESKSPGSYEVRFDAARLASGVYLYRLTAGDFVRTRKMTVLR